jgi:hypothetical protein
MTNNFFVFYRSYDPNFLNFQEPITLENADPFLFENTSSYIYKEYTSVLNFSSRYNNRLDTEFGNITLNLKTNYFVSESINSISNTIDLENNRSILYENNELIYLEYNLQITASAESGSYNVLLGTYYYPAENISTGSTILLENSRSLYLEDFSEFLLE